MSTQRILWFTADITLGLLAVSLPTLVTVGLWLALTLHVGGVL